MVYEALGLPSRFPCWCRAVYSWGGEGSKDLGFVEGDLIECLNAGDGSWWMGRLRRDPRAVGLFPSNFVEVLDDSFQPASRATSPLPERGSSPSPYKPPTEQPKAKPFRKAFSAYAAPDLAAKEREERQRRERERLESLRKPSPSQNGYGRHTASRLANRGNGGVSPAPSLRQSVQNYSRPVSRNSLIDQRGPSPAPIQQAYQAPPPRALSPMPYQNHSRAPSPQPGYQQYARAPSPQPQAYNYSRAPSPQPAAYQHSRAPSPQPYPHDTYARSPSPMPHPEFHNNLARPVTPGPPGGYVAYSPGHSPSPLPPHSRGPSPNPYGQSGVSPNPYARAASPLPPQHGYYGGSRGPSPAPYDPYAHSRGPSPNPYAQQGREESVPPPPPPHRYAGTPQAARADPYNQGYDPTPRPRSRSRCPPSPGHSGHSGMGNTPSPLRNAMDDVMSSLEGMGVADQRDSVSPSPHAGGPWSPEAFDQTYSGTQRSIVAPRPATSMDSYGAESGRYNDEPPVLSNYVARMESRLRKRYPRGSDESLSQTHSRGGHSHSQSMSQAQLPGNSYPGRGQESGHGHGSGSSSMAPPTQPVLVPDTFAQQPSRPHTSMADRRLQDSAGMARPKSALGSASSRLRGLRHKKSTTDDDGRPLRRKKSAFEVGKEYIGRTFTTKSTSTNASSGTQATSMTGYSSVTDKSVMSGYSAGGISATSAGSLNRKRELKELLLSRNRAKSELGNRENDFASIKNRFEEAGSGDSRPTTPMTGLSYHSSHGTEAQTRPRAQSVMSPVHKQPPANDGLGGFMTPKPKKSGFFKRVFESGKTVAANTRKTLSTDLGRPKSSKGNQPFGMGIPDGVNAIAGGRDIFSSSGRAPGDEGTDWVQVRRDVNRANSLSAIEIQERQDRARMHDFLSIYPLDELAENTEGDEDAHGEPVENPVNFQSSNLALVDKTVRFIKDVPTTNPHALATQYLCRPYKSDVQKLRAIFTWVAERIAWESELSLGDEPADIIKVLQTRRGCPEEVSVLFLTMARAVNINCHVVRGYLKTPGEPLPMKNALMPSGNHWWCTALVDGHWRMIDVCLASPSHPMRGLFSSTGPTMAESWYFLARPSEFAYSHIPEHSHHQHLVPNVKPELLLALPGACPPYFKNGLKLVDYNTALLRLENLEVAMIRIIANEDVEIIAEVETREFVHDVDGDFYESGEVIRARTLAQAEWVGGIKRYTIKAVLPQESSQGILKIYAGGRGLWHSSASIPHPVALALPLHHAGKNPAFEWVKRHPTPHANRHDIYVVQPQCFQLVVNNTYVFAVKQHPSTAPTALGGGSIDSGRDMRPGSALSIQRPGSSMSNAASVSSYSASTSAPSSYSSRKPAKLSIQSPSGKILRLMRKEERPMPGMANEGVLLGDGGTWETVIKCGERGTWRGLVLADRSARWCVFCEWVCV